MGTFWVWLVWAGYLFFIDSAHDGALLLGVFLGEGD
jgi:hypothetical protein